MSSGNLDKGVSVDWSTRGSQDLTHQDFMATWIKALNYPQLSPFTDLHVRIYIGFGPTLFTLRWLLFSIYVLCRLMHSGGWAGRSERIWSSWINEYQTTYQIWIMIDSVYPACMHFHAYRHKGIRKKVIWTIIYIQIMSVKWYFHIYIFGVCSTNFVCCYSN